MVWPNLSHRVIESARGIQIFTTFVRCTSFTCCDRIQETVEGWYLAVSLPFSSWPLWGTRRCEGIPCKQSPSGAEGFVVTRALPAKRFDPGTHRLRERSPRWEDYYGIGAIGVMFAKMLVNIHEMSHPSKTAKLSHSPSLQERWTRMTCYKRDRSYSSVSYPCDGKCGWRTVGRRWPVGESPSALI